MKKTIAFLLVTLWANLPLLCKAESTDFMVFPVSTEIQIGRIKNLLDRAPNGVYLSVGGERTFRGASMFEGIEYLIIFDISPTIIHFDKINMELLKAPNKEEYKKLRWEASFSKWQELSKNLTKEDFAWWEEHIRKIRHYIPERLNRYGNAHDFIIIREKLMAVFPHLAKKYGNFDKAYLHQVTWEDYEKYAKNVKNSLSKKEFEFYDTERKEQGGCFYSYIDNPAQAADWGQVVDYREGNYLFNEKLYQRIHKLALENKITVNQLDLASEEGIQAIISQIKKLNTKIAVLDLDNLYRFDYMGEEKFRAALSKLLGYGINNSILILMSNYLSYQCIQFSIYLGFTFENVRNWSNDFYFDAFINSLPADILPLINGRLYEENDKLPLYLMK